MEAVYTWIKNLVFCLCLLELLCHLVRSEDYRRYLRFFGSLAVLLLVLSPAAGMFSLGDTFEEALRQAFAREEAYELEASREALAGLQNRRISEAYQRELTRQMEEIVNAHGQRAFSVNVELKEKDGSPSAVSGVRIVLLQRSSRLNVFETEDDAELLQKAKEEISAEISAVYGIEPEAVSVTIKER